MHGCNPSAEQAEKEEISGQKVGGICLLSFINQELGGLKKKDTEKESKEVWSKVRERNVQRDRGNDNSKKNI